MAKQAKQARPGKAKKPPKAPLGRRLGASLRSAGLAGAEAVKNPRGIPATAHGAFRGWFRRIWDTRGGSAYTFGYALTFAGLEVKTIVGEIAGMTSVGDYVVGRLLEFVMRFGADTITNLVLAFLWPAFVVAWRPPLGIGLFVLALLLFPRYIRPHVERWLFHGGREGE